jgi:hypothetical protein
LTFTTRMRVVFTYPLRNLTRPNPPGRANLGPRTGGPVGLKAGGADRWPAIPGPAAAAYYAAAGSGSAYDDRGLGFRRRSLLRPRKPGLGRTRTDIFQRDKLIVFPIRPQALRINMY